MAKKKSPIPASAVQDIQNSKNKIPEVKGKSLKDK